MAEVQIDAIVLSREWMASHGLEALSGPTLQR